MPFHALARRRGWCAADAPTNVSMAGGCYRVSDAEYAEFLGAYADAVAAGERLYLVERPSARTRFYADLDLVARDEAHGDALADLAAATIARGAGLRGELVLLRAAAKPTAEGGVKVGVHLVMPRTRVDAAQAEALRRALLDELERAASDEGVAPPRNGWSEAFDESVYRHGGLRMVGSRKMAPCACREACPHPRRRVDAGRPYELVRVLGPDGYEDAALTRRLRANPALCAVACSIRTPARPGEAEPPPAKRARAAGGPLLASLLEAPPDPAHAQLRVADVATTAGGRRTLRLEGPGERWCPHAGREHASSSVYAVADAGGLRLRCHCRKRSCPAFWGPAQALSAAGRTLLALRPTARGLPPGFA